MPKSLRITALCVTDEQTKAANTAIAAARGEGLSCGYCGAAEGDGEGQVLYCHFSDIVTVSGGMPVYCSMYRCCRI
jgi:hypothetical protein